MPFEMGKPTVLLLGHDGPIETAIMDYHPEILPIFNKEEKRYTSTRKNRYRRSNNIRLSLSRLAKR